MVGICYKFTWSRGKGRQTLSEKLKSGTQLGHCGEATDLRPQPQAGLELRVLLPPLPEHRDSRYEPPGTHCSVSFPSGRKRITRL